MWHQLMPGLKMTLVMTGLTGLVYPLAVTGICQAVFRDKANGSLIERNGTVIGSALIGQNFARPEYFHPRPSAAGSDGYDATASGGSNFGPTSQKLIDRVRASVDNLRRENPAYTGELPADLATASGSGLDPHISPAAAQAQAGRVAHARGIPGDEVQLLIAAHTEGRDFRFLGEPRVNVLLLNLDLDNRYPVKR